MTQTRYTTLRNAISAFVADVLVPIAAVMFLLLMMGIAGGIERGTIVL